MTCGAVPSSPDISGCPVNSVGFQMSFNNFSSADVSWRVDSGLQLRILYHTKIWTRKLWFYQRDSRVITNSIIDSTVIYRNPVTSVLLC